MYRAGGVTAPRLIYGPEPEFSEEARKARFQGTVVLWLVVGPDGRTHDIRVQQSLGMGLDEKAIEAIRQCLTRVARMEFQWLCRWMLKSTSIFTSVAVVFFRSCA